MRISGANLRLVSTNVDEIITRQREVCKRITVMNGNAAWKMVEKHSRNIER